MTEIRLITLEDVWRFLERQNATITLTAYSQLIAEVVLGAVYGAFDENGEPIAIGGVSAGTGCGAGIIWLSVLPAGLGRHVFAIVRAFQPIVEREARKCNGAFAWVLNDNLDGARLARLAGCRRHPGSFVGHTRWEVGNGGCCDR